MWAYVRNETAGLLPRGGGKLTGDAARLVSEVVSASAQLAYFWTIAPRRGTAASTFFFALERSLS